MVRLGVAAAVAAAGVWGLTPDVDAKSRNRQKEARVELGRRLFQDPVASRGGKFSCASCHDAEHGFSDPRQFSIDENGQTARHSQPTTDLAGAGFHWDGEFETVEQLLVARLDMAQAALQQTVDLLDTRFAAANATGGPVDRGRYDTRRAVSRPPYYGKRGPTLTGGPPVVARLDLDGRYEGGFLRAYGTRDIRPEHVVGAVGAYMDTLRTTENPYDRHRRGNAGALSESARRGLRVFAGKAGCHTCHVTSGKKGKLLSDGIFHDTGVSYRGGLATPLTELLPRLEFTLIAPKDVGRAGQTFQIAPDTASFKTPSLRDVALRAPYMHDGTFTSLEQVVDYYDRGGTPHEGIDEAIRPLRLTEREKGDLVAFLHSLTGDERAGLGPVPAYRPDETRIRVLDLLGEPLGDRAIRVVPAGDRLAGTDAMPEPFDVQTDEWGRATFAFPLSTQVRLETDGYEIGLSRLIPDWSRKIELVATPLDTVSVTVRRANSAALPDVLAVQPTRLGGQTTDAQVTMKRVRRIDADTSIYAADRKEIRGLPGIGHDGNIQVRLIMTGHAAQGFELDTRGGQSDPFDMRRDSTSPIAVAGVRDPRGSSASSGSLPARPRGRSGPRESTRPGLPTTDTSGLGGGGSAGGGGGGGGGANTSR
jgi:cytochrome c peroxidase